MDDIEKIRHVVLLLLYCLLQRVQIRLDILDLSFVVLHRLRPCLKGSVATVCIDPHHRLTKEYIFVPFERSTPSQRRRSHSPHLAVFPERKANS